MSFSPSFGHEKDSVLFRVGLELSDILRLERQGIWAETSRSSQLRCRSPRWMISDYAGNAAVVPHVLRTAPVPPIEFLFFVNKGGLMRSPQVPPPHTRFYVLRMNTRYEIAFDMHADMRFVSPGGARYGVEER